MITLLTILTLFSICLSQDCEVGYSSINNDCYFDHDLDVLNTFINNSNGSINMILDTNNNGIIESLELCSQEWGNGRITLFDCNPIVIGNQYNWIELSGELPENINNWDNIETLLLPYNDLSGFIPESICEFNLDFSDDSVFNLRSNLFCPPFPECVEDFMGTQSNWGTGTCELSNCYDVGVEEVAVIEVNGDDILNPAQDVFGIGSILSTIYNDGPDCSQYPGLMVTADTEGVTFPFGSLSESEGEIINWWYAIAADYTYYSNIEFEVSPFVPLGVEINFTLNAVTMGCMDDTCLEDPYCHECPSTEPVSFSMIVGEQFPNMMGDANIDGIVDILDIIVIIDYILFTNQDEFDESNMLLFTLSDMNQDYNINIQDLIEIINRILEF